MVSPAALHAAASSTLLTSCCRPQVLLCASSQTSSIVECWSLRKEGLPVNNVFQQISPVGESPCSRGHWASSTARGSCSKQLRDVGPLHRLRTAMQLLPCSPGEPPVLRLRDARSASYLLPHSPVGTMCLLEGTAVQRSWGRGQELERLSKGGTDGHCSRAGGTYSPLGHRGG